jgi:HEAT repeat protein
MVMLALLGGGIWLLYPERDPLYTDLRSKSYKTRYAAAQQLGVKGAVSAVPHLTARIDDPYENLGIKTAAIKSLGQIGGPSAFSAIKDALENLELDPSVRAMAPTAFGIMQDRRSIEPMLQALSSQDDIMIQHNLLHSLHKFSGPEVDDGLRAFLESDHDSTIQAVALDMYAQMDRRKDSSRACGPSTRDHR